MKTEYNTTFLINTLLGTSLVLAGCGKLKGASSTDFSKALGVGMIVLGAVIFFKQSAIVVSSNNK